MFVYPLPCGNALKLSKHAQMSIKINLSGAETQQPTSCSHPLSCSPLHVQYPPKAVWLCWGWGRSSYLLSGFFSLFALFFVYTASTCSVELGYSHGILRRGRKNPKPTTMLCRPFYEGSKYNDWSKTIQSDKQRNASSASKSPFSRYEVSQSSFLLYVLANNPLN